MSLIGRSPVSISRIPATFLSLATSLIWKSGACPSQTASSVSTMPRAWSEWAEVPAAAIFRKLRAATVSTVAPQTPVTTSPGLPVSRQGPMLQFLQQTPILPIGQGFILCARSKQVSSFCSTDQSMSFCAPGDALCPFVSVMALASVPLLDDGFHLEGRVADRGQVLD